MSGGMRHADITKRTNRSEEMVYVTPRPFLASRMIRPSNSDRRGRPERVRGKGDNLPCFDRRFVDAVGIVQSAAIHVA